MSTINKLLFFSWILLTFSCVSNGNVIITKEKVAVKNKNGAYRMGRKLTAVSVLNCSATKVWEAFEDPQYWIDILNPQAQLNVLKKEVLPTRWIPQKKYSFGLVMNGFIPYGKHHLLFEAIDSNEYTIQTREYGLSVPTWDNYFEIIATSDSTCLVKDILEIQAGWLNWYVVPYAKDLLEGKHKRLEKLGQKK